MSFYRGPKLMRSDKCWLGTCSKSTIVTWTCLLQKKTLYVSSSFKTIIKRMFFYQNYKIKKNVYTWITIKWWLVLKVSEKFKMKFINQLAREPSVAQVTPAVYPHSDEFTEKLNFRHKNQFNQLRQLKTNLRTFPWFMPEVPNQNFRQLGPGVP